MVRNYFKIALRNIKRYTAHSILKLAYTPDEEIRNILLNDGGPSYAVHDPKTWPTQDLLAYQGRWGQLKDCQDLLIGGK